MKKITILLIALTALGCGKPQPPVHTAKADGDILIPQSLIGDAEVDLSEVLVAVNGKSLTRGEAMRQVAMRLGGPPPADMPAGRQAMIRSRVLSQVVDQFVKRTLLLEEAVRRGVAVSDAEIEKGIGLIRSKASDGSTPRGLLESGVSADESLRHEVAIGLRIDKLLAELISVETPSDEEVDAFIEANRKKLTHPEKGLAPRESIAKGLAEEARHKAISAYVRQLQQAAEIQHSSDVRPPVYAD